MFQIRPILIYQNLNLVSRIRGIKKLLYILIHRWTSMWFFRLISLCLEAKLEFYKYVKIVLLNFAIVLFCKVFTSLYHKFFGSVNVTLAVITGEFTYMLVNHFKKAYPLNAIVQSNLSLVFETIIVYFVSRILLFSISSLCDGVVLDVLYCGWCISKSNSQIT